MTRLAWDVDGEKYFESGVDRGVLYPEEADGVPWNGLVGVSEAVSGGEVTSYYYDGVKFLDMVAGTDYKAVIEAFTYPDEFGPCEGNVMVADRMVVTGQPRTRFHMSYRTGVGNDLDGEDHGFKIHLIYNCMVSPTAKAYKTRTGTMDPTNFTWSIDATPVAIENFKPTAHFVIDSRDVDPYLIQDLEDIIYGSDTEAPRMPTATELVTFIEDWVYDDGNYLLQVVDLGNNTWTATGPEQAMTVSGDQFTMHDPDATTPDANTFVITVS